MSMDFYRRPQLAGTALKYPDFPTIRGAVHRHDPDGTSSTPYFPIVAGGPFSVTVGGKLFTVTLSANPSMQTVITALNTATSVGDGPVAFSTLGYAYDEGGVVHIRALSKTSTIAAPGNTAMAWALGFDSRLGPIIAKPGDLAGAGEGRLNNPFGSAFPVLGESLNSASFVRALARLSTNLDVLLADHNRTTPSLVEYGTVSSIIDTSGGVSLISVAPSAFYAGLGVSNGLGALPFGMTLTTGALRSFFYLVTPAGNPSMHQVVGVVKTTNLAALSGPAPYVGASTAAGPGSVFGQNLVKAGPYPIDNIFGGRVVYRSGGFGSARVGDYVEIRNGSSTTITPWSNGGGVRWKVEAVDSTTLSLAPLSKAEIVDVVGGDSSDAQAIVSLNDQKGSSEDFGNLYLWTGPVIDGVQLVVSPAMPASAVGTVVWAAVPSSPRTRRHGEGMGNPLLGAFNAGFLLNDVISTKGTMSLAGGTLTISGMVVRRKGIAVDVNLTLGGLGSYTGFVYLSTSGALSLATTSPPLLPGTGIAIARVAAGAITHDLRVIGEVENYVTVGATYGQVADIDTAYQYCNLRQIFVKEIVLLYDQTSPTGGWVFDDIDVTIRGLNPSVRLIRHAADPLITTTTSKKVVVKNLTIPVTSTASDLIFSSPADNIWAVDCYDLDTAQFVPLANLSPNASRAISIYTGTGTLNLRAGSVRVGDQAASVYIGNAAMNVYIGSASTTTYVQGSGGLSVSYAISGASIAVTGNAQGATVIGTTKVSTPVLEGYGTSVPAANYSAAILEVNDTQVRLSPSDAAVFRLGDWVTEDEDPSQDGTVDGIDLVTGWVNVDPGGSWSHFTVGNNLHVNRAAVVAGGPHIRSAADTFNGPILASVKGGPRTDTYPILRVTNDEIGNAPVIDFTKDGFSLWEAGAQYTSTELLERLWRRFVRYGAVGDVSSVYFYKGNNSLTTLGGRPNINKLSAIREVWDPATTHSGILSFVITPATNADNLETLKYAKIEWFNMHQSAYNGAWDGSSSYANSDLTGLGVTYATINDRLFFVQDPTDPNNEVRFSAAITHPNLTLYTTSSKPACKVTLYNSFGPSETHWFVTTTTSDGTSSLVDIGVTGMPSPIPEVYLSPATYSVYTGEGDVAIFNISGGSPNFAMSGGAGKGSWDIPGMSPVRTRVFTPTAVSGSTVVTVTDANGKQDTSTISFHNVSTSGTSDPCFRCVSVDTTILLPGGTTKRAGDLKVGDKVWTQPEYGGAWAAFEVSDMVVAEMPLLTVNLEGGRTLTVSPSHRVLSGGSWIPAYQLTPGMLLEGSAPGVVASVVEEGRVGDVAQISIRGARTYDSNGILSHNLKNIDGRYYACP